MALASAIAVLRTAAAAAALLGVEPRGEPSIMLSSGDAASVCLDGMDESVDGEMMMSAGDCFAVSGLTRRRCKKEAEKPYAYIRQ